MTRIVVVGSLNLDLVMQTPRLPALGETLLGGPFSTAEGGKGANQSVACARMGASVHHLGRVGDDPFGHRLLEALIREGIDISGIHACSDVPTGVAQISVSAGDNAIVVAPGANGRLSPEDLRGDGALFDGAGAALFQLEVPLETVAEGLALARQRGVRTLLNPAPWHPLPEELLSRVDVLVLNRVELSQCAPGAEEEEALRTLLDRGIPQVVLTDGARGARYRTASGEAGRIPAPAVRVVDTTGAGDTFVGALAVLLAEGAPLEEAVRWGVHAGALACTRLGAQPSIPFRGEVKDFLEGSAV